MDLISTEFLELVTIENLLLNSLPLLLTACTESVELELEILCYKQYTQVYWQDYW